MNRLISIFILIAAIFGCNGGTDTATVSEEKPAGATVQYTVPDPMKVPEAKKVKSETDWEAKVFNKDIEIIQVLNVINPIAAFLKAGFEQYGDKIKNKTLHEEWADTQDQLGQALKLYDSCKERQKAGKFDKQLFLDMEGTWQLLVKTGVAGVRTKSMLDDELRRL